MKKILIPLKFILSHPLTKNNWTKALLRFLAWQIKSRFRNSTFSVKWIGDLHLNIKQGMHGATGIIYVGLPEFNDMSFLLHYLNEKDYFIDIGSNIGVYALLASGVKKTSSMAIEPVPSTYQNLINNINSNNLTQKITPQNIGLSNEKGQLFFTSDGDTNNHVVDKKRKNTISVSVDTLDNLSLDKINKPTLIKLDVEGFEYNVLQGAKKTLNNNNVEAIIVELNGCSNRFGLSDEMVDKEIESYGFGKYDYNPFERSLTALNNFHTEGNTLYIRLNKFDHIKEKLKSAAPYSIFNHSI